MTNSYSIETKFSLEAFKKAHELLDGVSLKTPLQLNAEWSEKYKCNVFLKREDIQPVRSYKIRGAYHKMLKLDTWKKDAGVICASAGNHAQGVAYSCSLLKIYYEYINARMSTHFPGIATRLVQSRRYRGCLDMRWMQKRSNAVFRGNRQQVSKY